jgi:hypothetical protein
MGVSYYIHEKRAKALAGHGLVTCKRVFVSRHCMET